MEKICLNIEGLMGIDQVKERKANRGIVEADHGKQSVQIKMYLGKEVGERKNKKMEVGLGEGGGRERK